ncbi:uncharacterized protein K489DRAFT_369561 [Dissoconium aciculare CBS 342.82]|uniref:Uncharacterized protein n=1 Tax=Dissoconium aciculare CBS 342.82 TaxID=1314786 RepID=A0A6J3M9L0_9PEZI|nr:uncharacterized protein K489DRAFT_369561 [Dissoconium aciculare CBS 342.82]KAF1824715.1 hypothetical protein K489DRAFT_369561 [Dissoconium aciculare CBS 342.82]
MSATPLLIDSHDVHDEMPYPVSISIHPYQSTISLIATDGAFGICKQKGSTLAFLFGTNENSISDDAFFSELANHMEITRVRRNFGFWVISFRGCLAKRDAWARCVPPSELLFLMTSLSIQKPLAPASRPDFPMTGRHDGDPKLSYERVGEYQLCDVICSFQSSLHALYARALSAVRLASHGNGYKNAGK